MRAKEMRERSEEELSRLLEETRSRLFTHRLKNATHQLDNTSQVRTDRREIARISTVLKEHSARRAGGAQTAPADEE